MPRLHCVTAIWASWINEGIVRDLPHVLFIVLGPVDLNPTSISVVLPTNLDLNVEMALVAQVESIDHVVLTCKSIPATIEFYTSIGMTHESFGEGRNALKFGTQKINLHQAGAEFEPKATLAKPGTADLCFIVSTDVNDVLQNLVGKGLEVLEGAKVVDRTGARGQLKSVYLRDPDGNLIELSNYVKQ